MQRAILVILLGLTLVALAVVLAGSDAMVAGMTIAKEGRIAQDMNSDRQPDYWETWSHGQLLQIEQDTNGDGRVDSITQLRNERPIRNEADTNYDGRIDFRETWNADGSHQVQVERNGRWEQAPVR